MSRGRFIYVSRLILKFNVKNSGDIVQASSFFDQKHVQSKKLRGNCSSSSFFGQKRVQSKKLRGHCSSSSFFVQKHVQSKKLVCPRSSSSFFDQMHPKTGSSSFFVQIGPQRVPGRPEAENSAILSSGAFGTKKLKLEYILMSFFD